MKTTLFAISAILMTFGSSAFAQNNWGWIARDVATASIYTAGSIRINDRQAQSQDKRTDADVKINDRQMESEDRRTVSNERIARDRTAAEVNISNTRTAAEVIMSGKSGTVTAQNGQITAQSDRPLPRHRRDEGGYNGPRQVN